MIILILAACKTTLYKAGKLKISSLTAQQKYSCCAENQYSKQVSLLYSIKYNRFNEYASFDAVSAKAIGTAIYA